MSNPWRLGELACRKLLACVSQTKLLLCSVCRRPKWGQTCTSTANCNGDGFICDSDLCKCDNSQHYYDKDTAIAGQSYNTACRYKKQFTTSSMFFSITVN